MNVFIDTNIFLSFYHFSNEDLKSLITIFASHENRAATVYLTDQVKNEFQRNRENKILDAKKKFEAAKFKQDIPTFLREFPEFEEIRTLGNKIDALRKEILNKANEAIKSKSLSADKTINDIFNRYTAHVVNDKILSAAKQRTELGNPPGKNGSNGDAINWEILLENVPSSQDIHIISEDGDFFSKIDENDPNPFLQEEWSRQKNSVVFVYKKLSNFTRKYFDGIDFSYDKEKNELIDALYESSSFATTHTLIAKLEKYRYFTTSEVVKILEAVKENGQVGWIICDDDVFNFVARVSIPFISDISDPGLLEPLAKATEEKAKNRT